MARPIRLEFKNAYYHIIHKGFRRDNIFFNDKERTVFLNKVQEACVRFNANCIAWCLVDNNYQLIINTKDANLSRFMHYLNTSYANWFRFRHSLSGPVFAGRYKSIIIDAEEYLKELTYLVHLTPVKDGIIDDPSEYEWSSCKDYLGIRNDSIIKENFINIRKNELDNYKFELLKHRNLTLKDLPVFKSMGIGNDDFQNRIDSMVKDIKNSSEKVTKQDNKISVEKVLESVCTVMDYSLWDLFETRKNNYGRLIAFYCLQKLTPLKLNEIAEIFSTNFHVVSKSNRRFEEKLSTNQELNNLFNQIKNKIV